MKFRSIKFSVFLVLFGAGAGATVCGATPLPEALVLAMDAPKIKIEPMRLEDALKLLLDKFQKKFPAVARLQIDYSKLNDRSFLDRTVSYTSNGEESLFRLIGNLTIQASVAPVYLPRGVVEIRSLAPEEVSVMKIPRSHAFDQMLGITPDLEGEEYFEALLQAWRERGFDSYTTALPEYSGKESRIIDVTGDRTTFQLINLEMFRYLYRGNGDGERKDRQKE